MDGAERRNTLQEEFWSNLNTVWWPSATILVYYSCSDPRNIYEGKLDIMPQDFRNWSENSSSFLQTDQIHECCALLELEDYTQAIVGGKDPYYNLTSPAWPLPQFNSEAAKVVTARLMFVAKEELQIGLPNCNSRWRSVLNSIFQDFNAKLNGDMSSSHP